MRSENQKPDIILFIQPIPSVVPQGFFVKKTTLIISIGTLFTIAGLVGIKAQQFNQLSEMGNQYQSPPLKVTYTNVELQQWESVFETVGSLEALDGVEVAAELTGKIVKIAFEAGGQINAGDILVQQDVKIEEAQLRSAEAAAELAIKNLERNQRLVRQNSASQSTLESSESQAKQAIAQLDEIKATITKKTIRAPFAGKLGVRKVSLGQDLQQGAAVVSLQKLDPILVNFYVPQRQFSLVSDGMPVQIALERHGEEDFKVEGEISAINSVIDLHTRNVLVQARVANPEGKLIPGMFVSVGVVFDKPQTVVAVPTTAVLYAPFGNSVFIIEDQDEAAGGGKIVRQQIVELGESRGDFVLIKSGLKSGEVVVTTGAFKLYNGQSVELDNTLAPNFQLNPEPQDS